MAADRDPLVEPRDAFDHDRVESGPALLRGRVLAASDDVRRAGAPPAEQGTAAGLLVEVSDALDADLETLDDTAWSSPVLFGWSVQDLVAHLTAGHEVLLTRLNGLDDRPVTTAELDEATEQMIAAHRHCAPRETRQSWRDSVCRLRHGLEVCDTEVSWLGMDVPAATTIVDRAFETWIHANDIRRATNRASLDPSGQHLSVLCDLAIELLPLALLVRSRHHDALVTVNLSGPGGGTWTMPLGSGAAAGVEFVFNAVARELCLLMGDRIDAADFAYTVRGDDRATQIARDLVEVAPSFARP